jgi:hypothetical protein
MPANAFIAEWRAPAGILFSSPSQAVQCAALTTAGPIGFDLGSNFSHCLYPGTLRDFLNPPLIRADGLTPSANLSSECHPGQEFSSFSECVERCPCGECPHEGSVYRPDLGILRHSSLPALLIQELAGTSRLVRNLQFGAHERQHGSLKSSKYRQASA